MSTGRDPRIDENTLRELPVVEDEGYLTLVGVVHDHPASSHRVRTLVGERTPDVLALELPPLALPLFEEYAEDERAPPVFGGEMSAAIQAADTDRIVGIDGPTPAFAASLMGRMYRQRASMETARRVLKSLATATRHSLVCRLAASLSTHAGVRIEVDEPAAHDVTRRDDPATQASDERDQMQRAQSVLDVFEPSRASQFRDTTRERYMADRLSVLRGEGEVLAVVGMGHLEAVADRLEDGDGRVDQAGEWSR